jgi:hypothetical protein
MAIRKTYARRLPNSGMPAIKSPTPGTGYMMAHDVKKPRMINLCNDKRPLREGLLARVATVYEGV